MLRFRGGFLALLVSLTAIAAAQVWPHPDFAPFVLTITRFDSQRVGFSDGRTQSGTSVYRLEYRDHDNWTLVLVSDAIAGGVGATPGQGAACRDGSYGRIANGDAFTVSDRSADGHCHYAPDRWVGYGMATGVRWQKTVSGSVITYEDPGERVSFDLRTGLPIRYEAGLGPNATGHVIVTYESQQP